MGRTNHHKGDGYTTRFTYNVERVVAKPNCEYRRYLANNRFRVNSIELQPGHGCHVSFEYAVHTTIYNIDRETGRIEDLDILEQSDDRMPDMPSSLIYTLRGVMASQTNAESYNASLGSQQGRRRSNWQLIVANENTQTTPV